MPVVPIKSAANFDLISPSSITIPAAPPIMDEDFKICLYDFSDDIRVKNIRFVTLLFRFGIIYGWKS